MVNNRDLERFLSRFEKRESGCWEWKSCKMTGGYGSFYYQGRARGAHRVSLSLFKNLSIDTKLDAMHSCDNPSCVNPDHLSYGTRTENMRDAARKGRTVRVGDWRGQLNPKSKLSPEMQREIISKVLNGMSRKQAAILHGITSVRVCQLMKEAGHPSKLKSYESARLSRLSRTTCKQGHELSGENLFVNTAGARVCRTCQRNNRLSRIANKLKDEKDNFKEIESDRAA